MQFSGSGALAATNALTLANTAGVTLDLNGTSQTLGSLSGGGTTGGRVTSSAAGAVTLTTGDASSTGFAGVIQDGTGTVAVTKQGVGVFSLSGINTYTGATNVNAGTLQLSGSGALAATNALTLANTAGVTLVAPV